MRITGGTYRSRTLVAPKGQATRPTSDRVREALFSILSARGVVSGAAVLDLYAGTGALGLEALSRGANSVTFVEKARDALAALRTNVEALRAGERCRIFASPVERGVGEQDFDLIFVDPPYADVESGIALRAVEQVLATARLAEGGVLVLEHAPPRKKAGKEADPALEEAGYPLAGLTREETRTYGDTCLSFYLLDPTGRT